MIIKRRTIDETEPWMMSYIDMATLLVAFFVTLLSVTQLNTAKMEMLSKFFSQEGGEYKTMPLVELAQKFEELVKQYAQDQSIRITLTERGVEINVVEKLLFDLGKSDIKDEAKKALSSIAVILKNPTVQDRRIIVE